MTSQDPWSRFHTAWGDSAQGYDGLYGHGLHSAAEKAAWLLLLERLLPASDKPLRILDVGTGTGIVALLAAELGHEVTGCDYAEPMLEVARSKAALSGSDLAFVKADAMLTDFDDGDFDVVICRHLLWALPRPEQVLRRWREVVHPGGKIIVIDQARPRVGVLRQGLRELADIMHPVIGTGDKHDGVFPKIPLHLQPLKRAATPVPMINALRRAGLDRVQAETLPWIDNVERQAMPKLERWGKRWNRYVVEGWV